MKEKIDNNGTNALSETDVTATDALTLKRKRIIAIISVVIAVAFMLWLGIYLTKVILFSIKSDEGIQSSATNLKTLIDSYGNKGILVAFAIQILQVVVSPIPGEVIEVGLGLCFGWLGGALICLLGGAIAAAIIMVFVKKLGIRVVELFVSTDKINDLKFINNDKRLERTVFLLYLIPGVPKDPLIFFFGLTRIKISSFVIISTLARIPTVVSSTVGGKFLLEENYLGAILLFAITGALSLLGMFAYHKILNMKKKRQNKSKTKERL